MNYIQKWLDDNGLKMGERFKIGGGWYNTYYIDSDYELMGSKDVDNDFLVELLTGEVEITKIEPKTRLEKIKKNGECWIVLSDHTVLHHLIGVPNTTGAFATEKEAQFEAKRRQLEEDMRDWQEANDTDDGKHRNYFIRRARDGRGIIVDWYGDKKARGDFRVWFKSEEQASKCFETFSDRVFDLYEGE